MSVFLHARNQKTDGQWLDEMRATIISELPNRSTDLSLLDLFYGAYVSFCKSQPNPSMIMPPLSVDHRNASVLTLSCADSYMGSFSCEIEEGDQDAVIAGLLALKDVIKKDIMQLPQIAFTNFDEEEAFMNKLIRIFKTSFSSKSEMIEFLDEAKTGHYKKKLSAFKAFAYLSDPKLFESMSLDEINLRINDDSISAQENAVIVQISSKTINSIISDGISSQIDHFLSSLDDVQNSEQLKMIVSFVQKIRALFINLQFDALEATAKMVELESFFQILKFKKNLGKKPKTIMVIAGVEHMQHLAELLEFIGAKSINDTDFIDEISGAEPKTVAEAFELCDAINQEILHSISDLDSDDLDDSGDSDTFYSEAPVEKKRKK